MGARDGGAKVEGNGPSLAQLMAAVSHLHGDIRSKRAFGLLMWLVERSPAAKQELTGLMGKEEAARILTMALDWRPPWPRVLIELERVAWGFSEPLAALELRSASETFLSAGPSAHGRKGRAPYEAILARADVGILEHGSLEGPAVPLQAIVQAAAEAIGVDPDMLKALYRRDLRGAARHAAAYLCGELTAEGWRGIAESLGGRHPASARYGWWATSRKLAERHPLTEDIVSAAAFLVLERHPHVASHLPDELQGAMRQSVERHRENEPGRER